MSVAKPAETERLSRVDPAPRGGVIGLLLGLVPYVIIAIVTWAAYANSLEADFIFDDMHNIVNNKSLHMTELSPAQLWDAATGNSTPRPVAYVSFALNYLVHELDVTGYHVVNTIIHMLAGFAVYALALHLLPMLMGVKRPLGRGEGVVLALGVALIFVAHPVQTQSVTYIVQRMASLCGLLYLVSMLCYIAGRSAAPEKRGAAVAWWVGALVFWVLALATKQYAVTLPLAILMYEWIARRQRFELNRRVLVAAGLGLLLMIGVVLVFKSGLFFQGGNLQRLFIGGYAQREFTMLERVLTQSRVVMHYLSLIFWPDPRRLILVYDYPLSTSLLSPVTTLLSMLCILGLLVAAWVGVRRWPLVSFGIFWYFLHLAVESTIIPLEMVYEHRLYLPLIGAALICAGLVRALVGANIARGAVFAVLVTVLAIGTRVRNEDWRHALSMWIDNAVKVPTEPRTHYNIAVIQYNVGKKREAYLAIERAIKAEPLFQLPRIMKGSLQAEFGDMQGALQTLGEVIRMEVDPTKRITWSKWEAYIERSRIYALMGRHALAEQDATSAIEFPPTPKEPPGVREWKMAESHASRGVARMGLGNMEGAAADYAKAIEYLPDHINAHNNLAWILATSPDASLRDGERAVEHAKRAVELTENTNPMTLSTYAASLAEAGQFDEAAAVQMRCLQLAAPELKERYRARLALYQSGQAYRDAGGR